MKMTIPKLCFSHMGAAPGLANIHTLTPHRCGRSILDAVPIPTAQEIVGAWNAGYRRRAVRVINAHRKPSSAAVPEMVPLRRTFAAASAPMLTEERAQLNADALTSQYYTSHKYVVRQPFLMTDGTRHPQGHTNHTFRTKTEAVAWIESHR